MSASRLVFSFGDALSILSKNGFVRTRQTTPDTMNKITCNHSGAPSSAEIAAIRDAGINHMVARFGVIASTIAATTKTIIQVYKIIIPPFFVFYHTLY